MKFLLGSCILLAVVHSWSESESRGSGSKMHQVTRYDHVDEEEQNTPMDRPVIGGNGVCAGVTNPPTWRNPANQPWYSFADCQKLCEHNIPLGWNGAQRGCPRSMTYNYNVPEKQDMYCFCHPEVPTSSLSNTNLNDMFGIGNLPYHSEEWGCYALKITDPNCAMAQGQYDCRGRCAGGHDCYSDGTCRRGANAQESCKGTCGRKNCCNSRTNRCEDCGSFTEVAVGGGCTPTTFYQEWSDHGLGTQYCSQTLDALQQLNTRVVNWAEADFGEKNDFGETIFSFRSVNKPVKASIAPGSSCGAHGGGVYKIEMCLPGGWSQSVLGDQMNKRWHAAWSSSPFSGADTINLNNFNGMVSPDDVAASGQERAVGFGWYNHHIGNDECVGGSWKKTGNRGLPTKAWSKTECGGKPSLGYTRSGKNLVLCCKTSSSEESVGRPDMMQESVGRPDMMQVAVGDPGMHGGSGKGNGPARGSRPSSSRGRAPGGGRGRLPFANLGGMSEEAVGLSPSRKGHKRIKRREADGTAGSLAFAETAPSWTTTVTNVLAAFGMAVTAYGAFKHYVGK